jgi:hypothetical protein
MSGQKLQVEEKIDEVEDNNPSEGIEEEVVKEDLQDLNNLTNKGIALGIN